MMRYCFIRFPGGKAKALTLSYDDGTADDMRLAQTLNRYGIKCTFNLVGSKIVKGEGLSVEFIREQILEKGHEIANHGYNHRGQDVIRRIEGIRDILDSRLTLEKTFGRIVRGMAFPDRSINRFKTPLLYEEIKHDAENLDIAYIRTAGDDNDRFLLPEDFYNWMPTAHHRNPNLFSYIDSFLALDLDSLYCASRNARLFYLWGHAFEFERNNEWELLERICERLSGKEDIWYATNMEIYTYIQAFNALVHSADNRIVYNPTLLDVWFDLDGTLYCIHSGETLHLPV